LDPDYPSVKVTWQQALPYQALIRYLAVLQKVFGRTPDGKMGYLDDMTSERVDAGGVSNIAKLAQKLPKQAAESAKILSMGSADDLKVTAPVQQWVPSVIQS
jgi:hypothetical protein